ncbi:hypothetical protein GCM10009605_06640 [Nocardiopsis composta]
MFHAAAREAAAEPLSVAGAWRMAPAGGRAALTRQGRDGGTGARRIQARRGKKAAVGRLPCRGRALS